MLKVTLTQEEAPESPRAWGNLGKLWCEHRCYTLGDDKPWWWEQLTRYGYLEAERYSREDGCVVMLAISVSSWEEHEALMLKQQKYDGEPLALWLPVHLYNHSGLALSTKPFHNRWDSGQVGFIVATQEDVLRFSASHVSPNGCGRWPLSGLKPRSKPIISTFRVTFGTTSSKTKTAKSSIRCRGCTAMTTPLKWPNGRSHMFRRHHEQTLHLL